MSDPVRSPSSIPIPDEAYEDAARAAGEALLAAKADAARATHKPPPLDAALVVRLKAGDPQARPDARFVLVVGRPSTVVRALEASPGRGEGGCAVILVCDGGMTLEGWAAAVARPDGSVVASEAELVDCSDSNEAEIHALILAAQFAGSVGRHGVILTDSRNTVSAFYYEDAWRQGWERLLQQARTSLPDGWAVAWVPSRQTRVAHRAVNALAGEGRETSQ
jgi:ribonuclease HI